MTTTKTTHTPLSAELTAQLGAFGEAFRQAHRQAKRSKREIAASVSMDRAGITKIEKGLRAPNLATLLELARAVDTTPAQLVADIGEPRAERARPEYEGRAPKDPFKRFAANLRWARARATDPRLTQFDLAWKADVDRSSLSGYETGRLAPNLRTILKLAIALELTPGVLLEGVRLN